MPMLWATHLEFLLILHSLHHCMYLYFTQRTIREAITAILGDKLHVGVLLQGKKFTDDSKTLHQAGISQSDKLGDLGFILEPNIRHVPENLTCPRDRRLLSLGCAPDQLDM